MTDSTPRRAYLSKRLRFDVLERDGFTCRYCGAKPEDGALHAEHIIPVVEGGKTEFANLITSCEPCNSGKGQRIVGRDVQPLPDMAALADEAVRAAAEIIRWRRAHKKREDTVALAAAQIRDEHPITIPGKVLERAIREFGIAEVDNAADITCARVDRENPQGQTSYMFAILRRRVEDQAEAAPMPSFVKPATVIASKTCPWGQRCPDQDHCIVTLDNGIPSACSYLSNLVGGWEFEDAEYHMWQCSSFVDAWRSGDGLDHLVSWSRRELSCKRDQRTLRADSAPAPEVVAL